jgi:phosphate transport system permease protein
MFTGAVLYLPVAPESVWDQTMALSLHLYNVSTQLPGIPEGLPFSVALTLIGVVMSMNALSIALRMKLRGRKKW